MGPSKKRQFPSYTERTSEVISALPKSAESITHWLQKESKIARNGHHMKELLAEQLRDAVLSG